jgi:DNA-binding NtrC family response regulator
LNVVPIHIPPLRERHEDIPLLAEHFIAKFNDRLKKEITAVTPEAIERLVAYQWPGNIRELENLMERTMLFCEGPEIRVSDLPPEVAGAPAAGTQPATLPPGAAADEAGRPAPESLKEAVRAETERVERELIQRALDATAGNVTQAARKLKISRKSLQTKMKELGLREK